MNTLRRVWDHFEEGFIAFLLAAMTLVTFVYVILNNLYTLFYSLADRWEGASERLFAIGDSIMGMAQAMTWSTSLTKALFAWLIFFGLSYGVRTASHIGVDALVRLTHARFNASSASSPASAAWPTPACWAWPASWVQTLFTAAIGAEDLGTTASCNGISP